MSDAVITMTGNASQLLAEYDKEARARQKAEAELVRLKKVSREVGESQVKMTAGARKALDDSTTAAEKYRATMASLRAALDSGAISQEKYNRARAAAQATFKATDPASIAKAAAAEKAASDAKAESAKKEAEAARIAGEAQKAKAKEDAAAALIVERNRTALEKYTDRVAAAKKALDSGRLTQEQYRREVAAANKELADAAPVSALQQQLQALATMATAVGAIRMAWKLASAEFDNYIARQKAAKDETISFADASREMMLNFTPDATMGVDALGPAIEKISKETGADQKNVAQAFSDAFSSKGDLTNKAATDFVAQAFRIAPKNPELAKELSARAMDLAGQTGVQDPKSLLGFLSQVQGQSRITSMPQLGKQGVPAILGGMKGGASLEQSAELFATINNLMKDAEGANSKTAMLQLVGQLMDEEKMTKAGLGKTFAGKGVMERLGMLQRDQKLADKFLKAEGVSFEIQAKPFIEGLVRGDAPSLTAMGAVQKGIKGIDATSPKAFDALVKQIESGPGQGVAALDAQLGAAVQGELVNGAGATAGAVRDRLFGEKGVLSGNVQNLVGPDFVRKKTLGGLFEAKLLGGASPQEAGIAALEAEMLDRSNRWSQQESTDQNRLLQETVTILRQQLEEQRKANANAAAPPAPGQPLVGGGNPALNGAPQ